MVYDPRDPSNSVERLTGELRAEMPVATDALDQTTVDTIFFVHPEVTTDVQSVAEETAAAEELAYSAANSDVYRVPKTQPPEQAQAPVTPELVYPSDQAAIDEAAGAASAINRTRLARAA